jgi:formylglycine-generating enzyme required for sulfatase activity
MGFYDLSGNAYEWVQDWYAENYYAHSPERNPQGPKAGTEKVYRGGG